MGNLLSAGLARLGRCKALWLSCAVMAGMETAVLLSRWREGAAYCLVHSMDSGFFLFAAPAGLLSALVCAFFVGPEHGDGTMRNKLVTGHRRRDVYLSALLLSCLASLLLCAAAVLPGLALGLPLLGGFKMGAARAALTLLGVCALAVAYAALFTLLTMLISGRAAALTASILLALVLLAVGAYLQERLDAQPTIQGYELSVNGKLAEADPLPNPAYLPDGPARDAVQLLCNLLPGGQSVQYASLSAARLAALILWDGAITLAATAVGLTLFRRRDLK